MATYREIVYAVLDLLKETSNDAFYTEEHILFFACNLRTYLLERKYRKSRNAAFQEMSSENTQQICLDLEKADLLPFGCSGLWLRSVQEIPDTLNAGSPNIYPVNQMLGSTLTLIPAERMPYVGYNKWLKNIIYAAIGDDNHLYMTGNNPQFMYLKKARMNAVFANPEEASKLACDNNGEALGCEILDQEFPLEAALVPFCIEMIVQEIAGPRYAPEDKENNAKDDLGEVALASASAAAPTESSERATYRRRYYPESE
jgi:hypothetical protein